MRKTFIVALVALLVAGIGGYFGFTFYVGYLARSHVAAVLANLKANGVEATTGEVRYDVFDGRFELRDIALAAPGQGALKVASFLATGVERPSPARLFAKKVEIEGIAFDGPLPLAPEIDASYRAPRIDVTALEIPSATPGAGTAWQVALAFLEQVTADRIAIPESTVSTRAGAGDSRIETDVTHGAVTFERLVDGRFATATIEPSTFTLGGAPQNAGKGSVGRVSAEGVDVGAMLVLLDPERRLAADAFRTVYGAISVDGYEVTTDGGLRQRWKSMALRDLAIRPSAIPAEELFAMGQRLQQLAAQGKEPSPEEAAQIMQLVAGVYDEGLRIGSIVFDGMDGTTPDGGKASLASLKAGPLEGGRFDQIALDKLSGTEADGKTFRVARLFVGGLRPGTMMDLAAEATRDAKALLNWPARLFSVLGTFELDDAEAPTDKGEPVNIDKLSLSWNGETDALPTRIAATLRMTGPTDAVSAADTAFALVPGQAQRVNVAMDVKADWNEGSGTATLDPIYVEVSDAFAVSARLTLNDVDDSVFSAQPDEAIAGAAQVNLGQLVISVTDAGLYDQKLEEAAKEQGIKPAEIRQLFAGFAELLLSETVSERPELGPAVQAFVSFIQKPMSTLALRITPRSEPLPVMTIVETLNGDNPLGVVDELDVEVADTP
ncbi:Uncharacterised protein [Starkeya nomas]|uniref:Uncharacterized protein n=1 Tax=Starkeya nomas TaxID=2666134 RepID=A0A5S9NG52_9HYPH|nr:hypothetical protein [Starkeya nomas]CAA0089074.1 Uncharacterised protein [Starkeya nomas]